MIVEGTQQKTCPTCGETKSIESFSVDKRRADGHGSYCFLCKKAYDSLYRQRPEVRKKNNERNRPRNLQPEVRLRINERRRQKYQQSEVKQKSYEYRHKPEVMIRRREWERAYKSERNNLPEVVGQNQQANRRLVLKRRGVSAAQYDELFAAQQGVCAICKQPEKSQRKGRTVNLAITQNVLTGDIRLLCASCIRKEESEFVLEKKRQAATQLAQALIERGLAAEQLSTVPHVAQIAASGQEQLQDARQIFKMILNGSIPSTPQTRLAVQGFLTKHPSSAD